MSQVITLLFFCAEWQANQHDIYIRRRQGQSNSIRSEEIGLREWIHRSDEIADPFEGDDLAIIL